MKGRETSEKAEQFNALLRKAFLLETQELDDFLNQVEDTEMRKQLDFLVRTADASTVLQFKTGVAGDQIHAQISETDQLLPGEKVGRFRVEKVIAQGGMGLVYLGFDELLGRNVAIKTIRPDHAFKPATQKRFIREAQILSQINDSRICQIYDFIEQSDCEFIVLEYIEGNNLNNPDLKLSQKEILKLFVQLAEALMNAHQQGIIHRDLKPDNLMVTQEPALKILDFGIARSTSNGTAIQTPKHQDKHQKMKQEAGLTVAGSIMGTLQYMSPEQIGGLDVTAASDMYSAGVILQELLTKDFAYELNDTHDLKQKVANAELQVPKNLAKPLRSIISDLTTLDPEQRLTAKQLKQRLNHIIQKPQRIKRNLMVSVLMLFIMLAAWFWNFRYAEANKTQIFNDYLAQAEELGNQYMQILSLPIHNIEAEMKGVYDITKSLFDAVETQAELDHSEKKYLQGMIYKNANYYKEALMYLEKSWQAGYRKNNIIHDLAETAILWWWNGQSYDMLTARPESEYETYKQKAYYYAQLSKQNGGQTNDIPTAYLLWRSKQFDEALTVIDQVLANEDWQFTGYLLKAAVYTEKMIQVDTNRTPQDNHALSLDAINAYKMAIERARSHPSSYIGLCQMYKRIIRDALTNTGYDVNNFFIKGVEACEQVLKIEPGNKYIRAFLATIYITYAEVQLHKGVDVMYLLEKAKEWTDKDIELFAKDSSYINKAEIHSKMAQIKNRRGINPEKEINQAVAAYNKAAELNPNTVGQITIGVLYNLEILAQYQLAHGLDMHSTFEEAQSTFKRFNLLDLKSFNNYIVVTYMNTAAIYYLYGKYLLLSGQNVDEVIQEGLSILSEHPVLFDRESYIYGIRAQLMTVLSQQQIKQGQDATATIVNLNENIDQALALFPTQNELLLIKANGLFLRQQNEQNVLNSDADVATDEQIRYSYQQAIEANPQYAQSYVDYANYLKFLSQQTGQKDIISEALELCDRALQTNPNFAEAFAVKADLVDLSGKPQKKVDELRNKAIALNPLMANRNKE